MLKRVGVAEILDPARNIAVNEKSSNSLHTISRRQILYDQQQMESSSKQGRDRRTWVDTSTIFEILKLRDEKKWEAERIEKKLGLAPGLVGRLGDRIGKP
jgi:transposase